MVENLQFYFLLKEKQTPRFYHGVHFTRVFACEDPSRIPDFFRVSPWSSFYSGLRKRRPVANSRFWGEDFLSKERKPSSRSSFRKMNPLVSPWSESLRKRYFFIGFSFFLLFILSMEYHLKRRKKEKKGKSNKKIKMTRREFPIFSGFHPVGELQGETRGRAPKSGICLAEIISLRARDL